MFLDIAISAILLVQSAIVPLNDDQLRLAYSGQTHDSFYRQNVEEYGGVYFEETYHPDGRLDYSAGDVILSGFWQITNGKICFQYDDTPLANGCFVVVNEGGCFYSYEVGPDGRPMGLARGEWWIRATIRGSDSQCSTPDLVS